MVCQECGLHVSDLMLLTYEQVKALIELHEFVQDSAEHAKEDEEAIEGEMAFFGP
jgi:hypothetical protein